MQKFYTVQRINSVFARGESVFWIKDWAFWRKALNFNHRHWRLIFIILLERLPFNGSTLKGMTPWCLEGQFSWKHATCSGLPWDHYPYKVKLLYAEPWGICKYIQFLNQPIGHSLFSLSHRLYTLIFVISINLWVGASNTYPMWA